MPRRSSGTTFGAGAGKPPRTARGARTGLLVWLAAVGVLAVLVVAAAVVRSSKGVVPSSAPAAVPSASAEPTAHIPAGDVTYACAGHAPDGVDITYGPSGSSLAAGGLPFTAHDPVSHDAQYFSISAQLQGSGDVTCTVTVADGRRTTRASATAEGGHHVASPEVCSDFQGYWQACS